MHHDTDPIASLSPQQVACLRLVAELRTSKQISDILGISSHTVDSHLSNAVRKLGVSSRMEAARRLVERAPDPPEQLTGQLPPVADNPGMAAECISQIVIAEPVGRQVTLPRWTRLAIIAGGAIALVYAIVLIVVGAEAITRMAGTGRPSTVEAASPSIGGSRGN